MPDKPGEEEPQAASGEGPDRRAERLAAALKANLARRKAQRRQRARAQSASDRPGTDRRSS